MVDPKGRQSPPYIPAPGPALWSHPCVAISSVQAPIPYHKTASPNRNGSHHRFCLYYGPEFVCHAVHRWCEQNNVELDYIEPGKPMQNGHVESFNGKLRDECLNAHWFTTLRHARDIIESWRTDYNQVRPHSALGYATPNEFASWSSASFAVGILSNTTAKPGQDNPGGLAALGLDPAPPSCERRLT
jgi:hypothetical protein